LRALMTAPLFAASCTLLGPLFVMPLGVFMPTASTP
jgi:hypothetical protein